MDRYSQFHPLLAAMLRKLGSEKYSLRDALDERLSWVFAHAPIRSDGWYEIGDKVVLDRRPYKQDDLPCTVVGYSLNSSGQTTVELKSDADSQDLQHVHITDFSRIKRA